MIRVLKVAAAHKCKPFYLGHARVFEHGVANVLIHAQRGRKHPAPHIGNTRNLKQTLHASVLAVPSVQNREYGVYSVREHGGAFFNHHAVNASVGADERPFKIFFVLFPFVLANIFNAAGIKEPFAVLCNAQKLRLIFFSVDIFINRSDRHARNLVLA